MYSITVILHEYLKQIKERKKGRKYQYHDKERIVRRGK
jgi:hypothetical protein